MYASSTFTSLPFVLSLLTTLLTPATSLGVNCRGSALCDRATLSSQSGKIVQIFRDAVYAAQIPDDTHYNDGDHILCISQTESLTISAGVEGGAKGVTGSFSLSGSLAVGAGGICLFPQGTQSGLALSEIRTLADKVLEHGCSTCGSVPRDWEQNDPKDGILTFNYVENPFCDGNCISDTGNSKGNPTSTGQQKLRRSAKFGLID
ncbi:uncharacterized protein KY384_003997 [Bacidia gigantensis]|uniref:uncharacterized protein n=1 Tax=Bacidia gigantensis TaxID=2732470 RepID=UPI001D05BCB3|nr:uncharacterized protein KY384_003997 [Bacidia gigantensis]KAG8531285.1 hypothetical protein KY384_003997 [Bacidia gigantensis]